MPESVGSPRRGVQAVVVCHEHKWFVDLLPRDPAAPRRYPVSAEDAWNYDVERNLLVQVRIDAAGCHILSRRGNKRFVRIKKGEA